MVDWVMTVRCMQLPKKKPGSILESKLTARLFHEIILTSEKTSRSHFLQPCSMAEAVQAVAKSFFAILQNGCTYSRALYSNTEF